MASSPVVRAIIATYNDPCMGELQVAPEIGTVAMGSGLQAWAFSVPLFALQPLTNTHPPKMLDPSNVQKFAVGAVGAAAAGHLRPPED